MKNENTQRREFLKKVAYSAPVIVGLGALSAPVDADAFKPSCTSVNGAGKRPNANTKSGKHKGGSSHKGHNIGGGSNHKHHAK